MSLEWTDGYKVGHDEIDAQHQRLFSLVNDFLAAKDKVGLTVCAMALSKYTYEHLAYEESLMSKWQYLEATDHLTQHNSLISLLDDVVQSLPKNNFNIDDLEAFLSDWLLLHIAAADQKLAIYLKFIGE
ncbi:bacteriohemerythrin [Rhodoferax sp.]|uniref:bacteriohemerythrin n=1 Tax=Rhodoferax sp. TaxID=50421 RepID=UPI0028483D8F|nr:bacteriohemerythrin [Rhodoferax sp.]MDR3367777.1 bacteriohemerythrin [Rhodoferax sp.]